MTIITPADERHLASGAWYLFRPELLFITKTVDEALPQARTRLLRFTEFETSNGPDVRVYLVAAPDARDEATVDNAGFVDLGSMKGNKGDQNYELVNFGTAALAPLASEPSR